MGRLTIGHIKMNKMKTILPVYFIAGTQDVRHLSGDPAQNLLSVLKQALEAGITCFQFRDKGEHSLANQPIAQKVLAQQCQALCRTFNVPFVINDDVALALELAADGVHVGQGDMPIETVLARTQGKMFVGLSTHSLEQAQLAQANPHIDYIGVGPIFPTQSKKDQDPDVGLDFVAYLRQAGITKPIVAIGGVNAESAPCLLGDGADGVAVISAIAQASDIAAVVKSLKG